MNREPINILIDGVCKPCDPPDSITDGMAYITHEGVLEIGGVKIKCYILNTGQRILDATDIKNLFGI